MTVNSYITDSKIFFRSAARAISHEMDKGALIMATMSFALAMERVLKGMLHDVNPLYVLINPAFKNSLPVLYKSHVINSTREVSDSPDGDVITFRNSLLRAEVISTWVHENKSLFFFLSESRDIIAHNNLSNLDLEKISTLLKKDFYSIATYVANEHGIHIRDLLSQQENRLSKLSAELQDSIDVRLKIILDNHKDKWEILKQTPGYVADKDKVFRDITLTPGKFKCSCPACGNDALIYTKQETEMNRFMGQEVVIGYFIKRLRCVYCKLDISDYDELSFLENKFGLQDCIEDALPSEASA